jgi:hypothetical protein
MIDNSGVQPNKAMIAPILKSRLFKYCFISLYVERLTFAPTRGRARLLTEAGRFSPVAVGRAVRRHSETLPRTPRVEHR